jgi:hypothetical protein
MEIQGLMPREDHGDHHSWGSRDYKTVNCKATNCEFNFGPGIEECRVPSRCKINNSGACEGFSAIKINTTEIDGD